MLDNENRRTCTELDQNYIAGKAVKLLKFCFNYVQTARICNYQLEQVVFSW